MGGKNKKSKRQDEKKISMIGGNKAYDKGNANKIPAPQDNLNEKPEVL